MNKVLTGRSRAHGILLLIISTLLLASFSVALRATTYRIEATLDEDDHLLRGTERIEFTNPLEEAVEEVVLKLDPNMLRELNPHLTGVAVDSSYPAGFDPGWTEIGRVTDSSGNPLDYEMESRPPANQTYSLEETAMRVRLGSRLDPGEETTIVVEFSTKFPHKKAGDEEVYKDTYVWRFGWYPTLAPADWWGGYDREAYSRTVMESADYHVELDVPEDFLVGGEVTSRRTESRQGSERKLLELELSAARSFPLVMSPNYRRLREEFKDHAIEVLHRPGYQEEARLLASYANEVLQFYSGRFGEYERNQLTFAQSPRSGYFGMAADGLIVFGDSFFTEKDLAFSSVTSRLSEYLIAHEIAHQWFGIGVGADLNSQNWISEAFSEFLALRYFHHKYPEEEPNLFRFERDGFLRNAIESQLGYNNLRKHQFELPYMINFQRGFDEAVIKPREEVKYANSNQTRIYKKGYLILRTLESYIGKEAMDEFLREVHRRREEEVVDVETLAADVRELADGEIPEEFFQEWLYTDGYLDYGIAGIDVEEGADDNYRNVITLTKDGSLASPVELRAELSSGETVEEEVALESERKKVVLEEPERVVKATVDPESTVMDPNRLNNHYPRKVEFAVGENRLPLDAHLISFGTGAITGRAANRYAWAVGPGAAQGSWNVNRNLTLTGIAAISGEEISDLNVNGRLAADLDFWSSPENGYAGSYRVQDRSLSLGFERVTAESGRSFNLLGIGGELASTFAESRRLGFQSTFSLDGRSKFSLSATETERLLPGTYLNLSANVGLSPGDLPEPLKFDLPELKSYGEVPDDSSNPIGWESYSYPGNYKLFSQVSLEFPLRTDARHYVGGLALITGVRQNFFLSAGNTWNEPGEIGPDGFKYEGGTELSVSGKTLGGLITFDLAIGYAYHGQARGRPYFNFSLGSI